MILSDLDVHREQTGGTARYFDVTTRQPWRIIFSRRRGTAGGPILAARSR